MGLEGIIVFAWVFFMFPFSLRFFACLCVSMFSFFPCAEAHFPEICQKTGGFHSNPVCTDPNRKFPQNNLNTRDHLLSLPTLWMLS